MKPIDDWTGARRLLCVRLDALGDVLMTTPALAALKASGEERHVTLLASSAGAAIAPLLPMVDETIVFDAPWMKAATLRLDGSIDRAMIEQLRRERFDAAVIFTVYSQNSLPAALFCHLADIPRRLAHARENPYQLLTHWIAEPEPQQLVRHEVQRQLDLVAAIGARIDDPHLVVQIRAEVSEGVLGNLVARGLDVASPWAVIHPGASAPSRRYPAESFAAAARSLCLNHACQLVFTGSAHERPLIESVIAAAGVPALCLAGKTNLHELAALLSEAPLLISNNTGPVHLAAAVGTPVVDLYALTNMQHAPWQVPHELLFHDVPCKNCYKSICPEEHHNCLRLVPPEAVVAAACRLIRKHASKNNLIAGTKLAPSELRASLAKRGTETKFGPG
jgi:lipopolysaccharide heptosyltransferase II